MRHRTSNKRLSCVYDTTQTSTFAVATVYTWHDNHCSSLMESTLLGIQLFIPNKPTNNHVTLVRSFVVDLVHITAHQYQTHLFNRVLIWICYVSVCPNLDMLCFCVSKFCNGKLRCFHNKSLFYSRSAA